MVPEDPSWPCTSAGELGTGEYCASSSLPGELISKNLINQANHRKQKAPKGTE